MENPSSDDSDVASSSETLRNGTSSRLLRFFQTPVSSLLEYSGLLRVRPDFAEARPLVPEGSHASGRVRRGLELVDGGDRSGNGDNEAGSGNSNGEVSIRIIGEQERIRGLSNGENDANGNRLQAEESIPGGADDANRTLNNGTDGNSNRETSPYQIYDIQLVARWIEQFFPFSMLLMVVFVRQHLQGFIIAVYITFILLKSNDIIRKQTALKGERKILALVGYSILFILQIIGVYWWLHKDGLFYSLLLIPPKAIPPFWHAVFVIVVNDTLVRQAAMVLKLLILMYYKNGRGHSFRKQGQMLTLVEYSILLYRTLLPAPIWYRFFLNKEYGSLFSSLITGLYLTFKLTSVVDKIRSLVISIKMLSRKEVHYGAYATSEQVNAAGDLCAICQEKMRTQSCFAANIYSAMTASRNGLNVKGHALCAGPWFDLLNFDRMVMDRQPFSSNCFNRRFIGVQAIFRLGFLSFREAKKKNGGKHLP